MNLYDLTHVALMHAFLGIFAVLVLFLVLAGVVVLIAWCNDRWQRRDHRAGSTLHAPRSGLLP